jgi:hypothetical protein
MEARSQNNRGKVDEAGVGKKGDYYGNISAAGAISNGPTGWTGGAPASSVFTVTHNLALTADSYQVFCTATGTAEGVCTVTTRGANSFTVTCFDESATPALADIPFSFHLHVGDGE